MAPAKVWKKYGKSTKRRQGPAQSIEKVRNCIMAPAKVWKKYGKSTKRCQGPAQSMDKVQKKYETALWRRPKVWTKYGKSTKRHQGASPKYGTSTDKV